MAAAATDSTRRRLPSCQGSSRVPLWLRSSRARTLALQAPVHVHGFATDLRRQLLSLPRSIGEISSAASSAAVLQHLAWCTWTGGMQTSYKGIDAASRFFRFIAEPHRVRQRAATSESSVPSGRGGASQGPLLINGIVDPQRTGRSASMALRCAGVNGEGRSRTMRTTTTWRSLIAQPQLVDP